MAASGCGFLPWNEGIFCIQGWYGWRVIHIFSIKIVNLSSLKIREWPLCDEWNPATRDDPEVAHSYEQFNNRGTNVLWVRNSPWTAFSAQKRVSFRVDIRSLVDGRIFSLISLPEDWRALYSIPGLTVGHTQVSFCICGQEKNVKLQTQARCQSLTLWTIS